MEKQRHIYSLADPRTGAVRYVGATVNPMRRLSVHCAPKARAHHGLKEWVASLVNSGQRPIMCILESVPVSVDWGERESWWIRRYESLGADLFNRNSGGDGPPALAIERWSRDFDACKECGRSDRRHAAFGLCNSCYNRAKHRSEKMPERPYYDWSLDYERCTECGTTEQRHKGKGLCTNCYARAKRRRRKAIA